MKKKMIVEFGIGTSLRRRDYTEAACRAVKDALWHNSINLAELYGFPKDAMLLDVEIGVQEPEAVDVAEVLKIFPYGQPTVKVVQGGLDIPRPAYEPEGGNPTVIANAAVSVSFDMERADV